MRSLGKFTPHIRKVGGAVIWFGGAMSGSGWVLAGLAGPAALVTQTVSPLVPAGMLCLLCCASTLPLTTW